LAAQRQFLRLRATSNGLVGTHMIPHAIERQHREVTMPPRWHHGRGEFYRHDVRGGYIASTRQILSAAYLFRRFVAICFAL
jgi:hypothetical protein